MIQTTYNFISAGLLLLLGVWWNPLNILNSLVKSILFITGMFGAVVFASKFF